MADSLKFYDGASFVEQREVQVNSGAFAANGQFLPTHGVNRPGGWYSADANKTFIIWQTHDGLAPYTAEYDHTAETWSDPVRVGDNPLTDDSHGGPTLLRDATGTLHATWGAHNTPLKHATSDNPDDVSSWTMQTDIVGDNCTYPKCHRLPNDDLYVAYRRTRFSDQRPIAYVKSTDDGATWSAFTDIVASQSGEWLYPFGTEVNGTDVHHAFIRQEDVSGRPRYDLFHVIHDTTDDSMRAVDGTALSTPVTVTERNNHCKVFDSATEQTNYARVALDNNGTTHLTFSHDNAGTWEYRHFYWTGSGWNGPTTITGALEQSANGDLLFVDGQLTKWLTVSTGTRGGHIEKWTYDGTWSKVTRAIEDSPLTEAVGCPSEIRNGVSGLRMACSEIRLDWTIGNRKIFGVDEYPVAGPIGFVQRPLKRYNGSSWVTVGYANTTVDRFEQGNLDPYAGDVSVATVQSTVVSEGSNALQIEFTADSVTNQIYSTSGLNAYPEAGDTYKANVQLQTSGSSDQLKILYGFQDSSNYYAYIIRPGDVRIRKYSGGSFTDLYSSTVTVPEGEFLEFTLDWATDGTQTATLTDASGTQIDSGSGTDTDYSGGGVGWGARDSNNNTVTTYFDNARIV